MTSSIAHLADCTTPVQTAKVYNPTSSEYYLADQVKAVEQARPETDAAVKVTLSQAAQDALKS